jgi:hypothetical protein|tara:strand:- start:58 stop:228 length:171 start_codon:yes stop_codon:yes gene_type:complete
MKNHSLDYGDNIACYLCCDVFDARNDPHDIIGSHFICGGCLDSYDDEELKELIADR